MSEPVTVTFAGRTFTVTHSACGWQVGGEAGVIDRRLDHAVARYVGWAPGSVLRALPAIIAADPGTHITVD